MEFDSKMQSTIDTAQALAIKAHNGHINPHNGEVYLLHVQRVAIRVRNSGHSRYAIAAAWLHDTIEDTDLTLPEIQEALGDRIAAAVAALTHVKNEPYGDYVRKLSLNPIAKVVKFHDIQDNFRRNHLITDEAKRLRMAKKYSLGLDILSGAGVS